MTDCLVLIIVTSVWSWRHQTYLASLATSRFRPSEGHCETVFVSVRGHQASTVQRQIWTFLVLKSCHERVKISNMHLSQFSSNFKLRFFRENRIDKLNSKHWSIMFLVNLLKFGQKFVQMTMRSVFETKAMVFWHMVSREPPITHSQARACMRVSQQDETKQKISIFANLLSANIGHKNQQNNVSTHIQQQPRGCNCYNKKYYLFKIFLRQNTTAKWKTKIQNFMLFQARVLQQPIAKPVRKLSRNLQQNR